MNPAHNMTDGKTMMLILVDQRIVCNRPYPPGTVQSAALFRRIHISSEWQRSLVSVHLLDWPPELKFQTEKKRKKTQIREISKKRSYLPQNFCCSYFMSKYLKCIANLQWPE